MSDIRRLVTTPQFERASKRFIGRDGRRRQCIKETLRKMEANLFDPSLKTHRLTGEFAGFFSSSCGYDCRIVFRLERDPKTRHECIVLTDVGTHDEVY